MDRATLQWDARYGHHRPAAGAETRNARRECGLRETSLALAPRMVDTELSPILARVNTAPSKWRIALFALPIEDVRGHALKRPSVVPALDRVQVITSTLHARGLGSTFAR